ncbi:bifunctional hydroxymethylpyrimidine kinase/phosphomethylpyrimidine kinase [Paucibacter sp. APW11]|uniref:Bifunctional hydroxymethylpyrimidine kinase/phosphomethylpyrimidine kinase n=1 Tax=Roseateles aquae TaxID=3077235 RepID=A0ABU3PE05_9BURK|nr:bifunctional hydroxymethylpyrimidine kinase/phosphomethylpyrimidine kinase [Paucibacter sp. APW11]MDT9000774.1 bifunctional hydroxymethylpyrimidine kinase/phosphomethylpyrimidine kinase [Paucibacter sp. APW11]
MPSAQALPHPSLPSPWASDAPWDQDPQPPVIWSLAGTDSGGGAGLAADGRAAAAFGVHLCPLVAAVTAQHSQGVAAVFPLPREQIEAQLDAVAADLPPRVIKTGLLASVGAVEALIARLDALRQQGPVELVIDPVLGASAGGAAFADAALLSAYREQLLPRASLITPNRREAERLLSLAPDSTPLPALAAGLRALGAAAVCITGGDDRATPGTQDLALDWIDDELLGRPLQGWLALPRLPSTHHHGSGCSFATAAAAALARGFVLADALLLAKMMVWCAVRDGHAAGAGAGPVRARSGFIAEPAAMPVMSFGNELAEPEAAATLARWGQVLRGDAAALDFQSGLYGISSHAALLADLAPQAAFAHLQLRIKAQPGLDDAPLRAEIRRALAAETPACRVWINDHWALALDEGAQSLHLGQEDWAALGRHERQRLLAPGLRLGLSSHSLWELARARSLAPCYIACGPVWATTTKDMPWLPQGTAQLRWWVQMAGRPVVAIGGITTPGRLGEAAASGVAAACLVRALEQPGLERYLAAWRG